MRTIEIRFTPKPLRFSEKLCDDQFIALIDRFVQQLAINGLTLESDAKIYIDGGDVVLLVTEQDEGAVDEDNMSYDTRKVLADIIKRCSAIPLVLPRRAYLYPEHCTCEKPSCFILQSPPEWEGSPVKCGDCDKSVPLYHLQNSIPEREFTELLLWRRTRRGYHATFEAGLDSGASYTMLRSCASDLSLFGRRLAGIIEVETGILTLYPLFSYYEKMPAFCPQCGKPWHNDYTDAIKYKCFCRECRLVM